MITRPVAPQALRVADDGAQGADDGWIRSVPLTRFSLLVPTELLSIARLIADGDQSRVISEAERLALLGSASAKALLAYLEMVGFVVGELRYDRAEQLAMESAARGNSLGHYVLGWIRFAQNRRADAFASLLVAAKQLFLPAMVDVGRFMAGGVGVTQADVKDAERVLLQAHRLGHRGALVFLMSLYRTGARGFYRRLVGMIVYPYALLRREAYARYSPFSDKVFAHSWSAWEMSVGLRARSSDPDNVR